MASAVVRDHIAQTMDDDAIFCESPIERVFITALSTALFFGNTEFRFFGLVDTDAELEAIKEHGDKFGIYVKCQPQIEGWRPDFLIHYYDFGYRDRTPGWRGLIVECDGHDFHERTKKQAARDRSRDRAAQHAGLPVLRFTGSELWADPWGCAMEVIGWAQKGL